MNTQLTQSPVLSRLLVLFLCILITACSSPRLREDAIHITVATKAPRCTLLSDITVVTNHTQFGVVRSPSAVASELQILAKNTAVDIGGTTIVATSAMLNGEQTYSVYRCAKTRKN